MLDWFKRLRRVTRKLVLPSRDAQAGRSGLKLNPAKLTPEPELYLARLSYLLFTASEILLEQSESAPNDKLGMAQRELGKKYLNRSKQVDGILEKLVADISQSKDLVSESVEQFHQFTLGRGWHENLIRMHIGYGILEELYKLLAKGLSATKRVQLETILSDASLEKFAKDTLKQAMAENPNLSHQLALFARAIVADVLLEVKNSVSLKAFTSTNVSANSAEAAKEAFRILEPLTSELIAAHTKRMDELGLTA